MPGLTIHEAAATTGWSARMLRYVERVGLVEPPRSAGGYRLYGPEQLQRLRTLRELLDRFGVGLADVGFAARLRRDEPLRTSLEQWFETQPTRPTHVAAEDWLRWEQDKHQALLTASASPTGQSLTAKSRTAQSRTAQSRTAQSLTAKETA